MNNYQTITLANGLRVIHLPSDSPVVYCGFGIRAGSCQEDDGREGVAHFCEHVTFKGTSRRSALQILNTLERVGGDLNAFTNKEDTVFYAAVLRDHLPKAVDLLCDIVFHSTFPEVEVRRELDVICDEIESYNDSPAELIYDDYENLLFRGHPLGHNILGDREVVAQFTADDARAFTRKYYRPDNAIFFAYGNVDFSKLVRLLERHSDWAEEGFVDDGKRMVSIGTTPPAATYTDPSEQVHRIQRNTHQAHVMLGCRTFRFDDKRRLPLYLLNNLLGGPGMNARFNLSLRERHGLVYTVDSSMANYHDTGVWSVYFGCDHHDVKRCLQLVHRELDRLVQAPLSPRQLQDAKQQLKGQIVIACDNREQYALDFAKTFLHYDKTRDINLLLQQIDALTADALLDVAQSVFAPERLQTLVYE